MSQEMTITRVIQVEEEIWTPTEREEKGKFFSLDDQRGVIQLDLLQPLELSDREAVDHLLVKAPNTKQIQAFQSTAGSEAQRELNFFGGCCQGIKPEDISNLHGYDFNRLTRLVTNFIL